MQYSFMTGSELKSIPQSRQSAKLIVADWLVITSAASGLISPFGFMLLIPALLLRGGFDRVTWRPANLLLLLATSWACLVIANRGTADSVGTLPYYAFLWFLPHILTIYRPDKFTLEKFELFIRAIFLIDFLFNVFAVITGGDILGRALDVREGVIGGRLGGIFAHSFYSGAISLAALLTTLSKNKFALFAIFPAMNMIMAGSWRFSIALFIIAFLVINWRKRTRIIEILLIFGFSVFIVVCVLLTSEFFEVLSEPNRSNTFRVFAWFNSIEKILNSPWLGVGYQNVNALVDAGVSFETLDEYLIGESWYLDSALTFGVPYTIFFSCCIVDRILW